MDDLFKRMQLQIAFLIDKLDRRLGAVPDNVITEAEAATSSASSSCTMATTTNMGPPLSGPPQPCCPPSSSSLPAPSPVKLSGTPIMGPPLSTTSHRFPRPAPPRLTHFLDRSRHAWAAGECFECKDLAIFSIGMCPACRDSSLMGPNPESPTAPASEGAATLPPTKRAKLS